MGAVFSFWEWAFAEGKEAYMIILGLDASGKTTLLTRLKTNEGATTVPTIGFTNETIKYGRLTFNMFDIGGQHKLRGFWHHYYENANAVIFVVDSSDISRMNEAKAEIDKLLVHPLLVNVPFLFFANKQDLPNALNRDKFISRLGLLRIRDREWVVSESVATDGKGIEEGFDWLSKHL